MIVPRLQHKYFQEIVPELQKQFHLKSCMQVPRLEKICINQGIGSAVHDKKLIEIALQELSAITGQKAVPRKAKKSISNFKLREGVPIGVAITLRGKRMYEFMDRLVTIALPRVRDFKGVSEKGFDGRGNYTLGINEQIIFPEISIDKVNKLNGMSITFVLNTNDDEMAYSLLKSLGMPLKNKQ